MVNKTELMAVELLKGRGYKREEIKKIRGSPDFVCSDGKRYEVKLLYGNKLIFYSKQIESLKDEDIILVFNRVKFIEEFEWGEKSKTNFEIKVVNTDNLKTLKIGEGTHQRLMKVGSKADTFEDIIKRLLDYYKNNEEREE